jgi:hypothetical protein
MRGETQAARGPRGRTEGRKSSNSNASRVATVVRSVRSCAVDNNNKLNVLRKCVRRSSRARRSPPRGSARGVVAGVVAAPGGVRLALRQRLAHRRQRIRVHSSGHRARLVLLVRRKRKRKAVQHRVPRVTADRNGEDVSGVAARAVVTAADRRADRLLRNRAGLLD